MRKAKSTIQVRTNDQLKKKVQAILEEVGLDFSSAINLYLRQIVIHEGIPFRILTENGFTPEEEAEIIRETEEAIKFGKRYDSIEELHRDILEGDDKEEI